MKIAQVHLGLLPIPPNGWGAVEKIIWEYKLNLESKGHTVDIPYSNEVQKDMYDIVHVHVWNHALEMHERGIPYIFTCHDHHAYVNGKDSIVYKNNLLAMQRAKLAIVPARFLIEYFDNIPIYIRHGINPDEFSLGTPNDIPKLLCVGNNGMNGDPTFDRKGFRLAIEAAEKLNMNITCVGPTNDNRKFFETHSDLLKPNVNVLYDLNDKQLQEIYRSHDILVHMSSIEAGHPPLTLLEAASTGLPIITTDCGGDLYAIQTNKDVDSVVQSIREVIKLYALNRSKTIKSVKQFYWSSVVDDLVKLYGNSNMQKNMRNSALSIYKNAKRVQSKNMIAYNFVDGPFVEITGQNDLEYNVKFIDKSTNKIVHETNMKTNHWVRCNRKWATDWTILITSSTGETFTHDFNPFEKQVLISFESSSLGDTLAWLPYVEEFRKKYNCKMIVSTFLNTLFESQYPEIQFVKPGTTVHNLYALYRLGIFLQNEQFDSTKHKTDYKKLRLQEVATDILGLDFQEVKPRMIKPKPMAADKPYICIGNHSTAQSKYWNNKTGWQELVDYVKSLGYDVYLLSKEEDGYMGNKNPVGVIKVDGKSLEEISSILLGSKGFVGISSGLSWLAWSLGVPTTLISGCTEEIHEPSNNVHRVINTNVCNSCFSHHTFDKGDWNWCPLHKGTSRQFECSKEITFDMVKPSLNQMLGI